MDVATLVGFQCRGAGREDGVEYLREAVDLTLPFGGSVGETNFVRAFTWMIDSELMRLGRSISIDRDRDGRSVSNVARVIFVFLQSIGNPQALLDESC